MSANTISALLAFTLVLIAVSGCTSVSPSQNGDPTEVAQPDVPGETGLGVNLGFYHRLLNEGEHVFRQGYETGDWSEDDRPFNPDFLELFEPFDAIRFHQTHLVSFSTDRDWSDRAQPNVNLPINESDLDAFNDGEDVRWPYEWEIRLANVTGTDLWITVPHMANTKYLTSLARLIRDNLNPELDVYLEYSNEVWNHFYADGGVWDPTPDVADGQYTYALEQGRERFSELLEEDGGDWEPISYWYVHASIRAWHAFEQVLAPERVHRVLAWLSPEADPDGDGGWNSMVYLFQALESPEVQRVDGTPVSLHPDVFAVNAYFNGPFQNDEPVPEAHWSDYRDALSALAANLAFTRRLLDDHGYADAALMSYEGGQHITHAEWAPEATNREPEMYDLYCEWLNVTGRHLELTMHYALVSPFAFNEAFGLKEYITQPAAEAHKWRAVLDYVSNQDVK